MLAFLNKENDTESQKYDQVLRRLTGYFGLSLPIICMVGGLLFGKDGIQDSVSAYYYTNMGVIFSGIMFFVGCYLMVYRGYHKIDRVLAFIAGCLALIVAIVPCRGTDGHQYKTLFALPDCLSKAVHLSSASLFFFVLAIMALVLFTRSNKAKSDRSLDKHRRNRIYQLAGGTIILILLLLGLSMALHITWLDNYKLTLIGEIIMLNAFSISWLVKGKVNIRPWLVSEDSENPP